MRTVLLFGILALCALAQTPTSPPSGHSGGPLISVDVFGFVSLMIGIIGGVLGVLSIWLSVKFYQMSSGLFANIQVAISGIQASSKTTEATTLNYTGRLVEAMIGIASENLKTAVLAAEHETKERIRSKVDPVISRDLLGEVEAAFAPALRGAEKLQRLARPAGQEDLHTGVGEEGPTAAGLSNSARDAAYDWAPFIRIIATLEKNQRFLSVKWLQQKKFADDLAKRDALQIALDKRILETERIPNPQVPEHPVLTCKLNRKHPLVVQTLGG